MSSIFTRIVNQEVPCHKLYEDDQSLAFLDQRPINPGHALVIPKSEIDYVFDLPDELLRHLITVAKNVARAIDQTIDCKRVGVIVAGLEVPHAHIHLIPINGLHDMDFTREKVKMDSEEFETLAQKIREQFN